jgi:hypothetical protein
MFWKGILFEIRGFDGREGSYYDLLGYDAVYSDRRSPTIQMNTVPASGILGSDTALQPRFVISLLRCLSLLIISFPASIPPVIALSYFPFFYPAPLSQFLVSVPRSLPPLIALYFIT